MSTKLGHVWDPEVLYTEGDLVQLDSGAWYAAQRVSYGETPTVFSPAWRCLDGFEIQQVTQSSQSAPEPFLSPYADEVSPLGDDIELVPDDGLRPARGLVLGVLLGGLAWLCAYEVVQLWQLIFA